MRYLIPVVMIAVGLGVSLWIRDAHNRWLDDLDDRQRRAKHWTYE